MAVDIPGRVWGVIVILFFLFGNIQRFSLRNLAGMTRLVLYSDEKSVGFIVPFP